MADSEAIILKQLFVFFVYFASFHIVQAYKNGIAQLQVENVGGIVHHSPAMTYNRRKRESSPDKKCDDQWSNHFSESAYKTIDGTMTFQNETKTKMALTWAGENDGTLIIVTSEAIGTTGASTVFRSTDYGKHFENLTQALNLTNTIKHHNGLQRNPHDAKKVYLVGVGMFMYITEDGGNTFNNVAGQAMPFIIEGDLIFHSNPLNDGYLMAKNAYKELYISWNNGKNWKLIRSQVDKAVWGIMPDKDYQSKDPDTSKTIYLTYGNSSESIQDPIFQHFFGIGNVLTTYKLMKSHNGGVSWTNLLDNVLSFDRQGKFLYASVVKNTKDESGWRQLMISTDGGTSFHEVQLPTIESDRFFSVMDVEDNMVMMHVDNVDDTGHGTLYISGSDGIIYSESLPRHLYPNFGEIHDFYKVKSMRGVYITSQMSDDDSIHTMITYNRGGTWQRLQKPDNATCKGTPKGCYLNIHGLYSVQRNIKTVPPLSEEAAVGIILAHGHVADALQKSDPDVYVSSDGGYTWNLALSGPHQYQIGDHGGLLVAVSLSEPFQKVIKFSLDEGTCWHEYMFTEKNFTFTGLLTEPDGNSTVFLVWGYETYTMKWEVHVIDFKDIVNKKCGDDDYETWLAHSSHRIEEGVTTAGCLLGVKETFYRLKKDSWCYNGYTHKQNSTNEICKCTREDYECDYGFYRPGGSDTCQKISDFKQPEIDICLRGHESKLVSEGYRKIPGDKCNGGFTPDSHIIDLNVICDEFGRSVVQKDETEEKTDDNRSDRKDIKIVAVVLVIVVLILAFMMAVYFIKKFILLHRHKTGYRYSQLSQVNQVTEENDEAHLEHVTTSSTKYHDSDEELTTTCTAPSFQKQNGIAHIVPKDMNPMKFYHDDSDDDLLS